MIVTTRYGSVKHTQVRHLPLHNVLAKAFSKSVERHSLPNGISSGGIFFSVRRRWDIVCAANNDISLMISVSPVQMRAPIDESGGHTTVLLFLLKVSDCSGR